MLKIEDNIKSIINYVNLSDQEDENKSASKEKLNNDLEKDLNQSVSIFRKIMMSVKLNETEFRIMKKLYDMKTSQDYLYHKKNTFYDALEYSKKNLKNTSIEWGWKEPNTHMILPFLLKKYKNLRYIHIMRNGLDNAYSKNQNQTQCHFGNH